MNIRDIFNLRLVCRLFCATIDLNQASIVRHLINQEPLRRFAILYQPLAAPTPYTLNQLFGLCHRFHVVDHLADFLAKLMVTQLNRITLPELADHPGLLAVAKNMTLKMQPYLLMLFHFLETYRAELVEAVKTCDISVENVREATHRQAEAHVVRQYNGHVIHDLVSLSRLLIRGIGRKQLRPSSYAGMLERRLRGWSTKPASEEQCMRLFVIGGLESVYMVISLPDYSKRIDALKRHLQHLSSKPMDPQLARRFCVMSRNNRHMKSRPELSTIMPPLDEPIANRISQLLPNQDDFLNIQRLSALFEPGVVLVDKIQNPWDFSRSLMFEEYTGHDFGLQAGAPAPDPDGDSSDPREGEYPAR